MASIKYLIQGKSEQANIYVQVSVARGKVAKRRTGFFINPKFWDKGKGLPKGNLQEIKQLKLDLDRFRIKLEVVLNSALTNGTDINGEWLQDEIDTINKVNPKQELDKLLSFTQYIIDNAGSKPNQKGGIGLSERRVKGYGTFKTMIQRYQKEAKRGRSILVREIDLKFSEEFKKWLFDKGYSVNYVGKNIDNLKAVCNEAERNGIETSGQLRLIKSFSKKRDAESLIVLSEKEQDIIAALNIDLESLRNARKWLLLGCQIGQRGSDLLRLNSDMIKVVNGMKIIHVDQQKTGKSVVVPLLPKALEAIEHGFPYSISLQRFNEYIKEICKQAGFDQLVKGVKRPRKDSKDTRKGTLPGIEGLYPKHELIGSHVCRRSFATNFYGKIPTPVLMGITAHGTEKVFLKYIGKTSYDNAFQMMEHFGRLSRASAGEAQMEVIKNSEVG